MSITACSRFCQILLRFHVYAFLIVITAQFIVGLYTEWVLEKIHLNANNGVSWVLRDVINWHKFIGNVLIIAAFGMVGQKIWLIITKPPRPILSPSSVTGFLIANHWLLLLVLLPAQYLTTVMAGDVAKLTGLEQKQVFAAHWYISLMIMAVTLSLFVQKLFFLPNSLFARTRSSAQIRIEMKQNSSKSQ